jgi:hypothetical protein
MSVAALAAHSKPPKPPDSILALIAVLAVVALATVPAQPSVERMTARMAVITLTYGLLAYVLFIYPQRWFNE